MWIWACDLDGEDYDLVNALGNILQCERFSRHEFRLQIEPASRSCIGALLPQLLARPGESGEVAVSGFGLQLLNE